MATSQRFNWKGITDNGDGSYSADDKRAKTRLLKELHRQGVAIRSSKVEGGGWKVYPIGGITKRKREDDPVKRRNISYQRPRMASRQIYRRAAQRTQYSRPMQAYPPQQRQQSGTVIGSPPRARAPGIVSQIRNWHQKKMADKVEAQRKEIEWKKNEQEISKKMAAERIQPEREEAAEQVRQNETKARLRSEQQTFERQQAAQRMRSGMSAQSSAGTASPPRQKSEEKLSSAEIQQAREDYISGE